MEIISRIDVLRERLQSETHIGFVPTMGNLHDGHLHLMKLAREQANCVVASIFVNPLQFGANEDLANYPRTLAEDCHRLQAEGVDIVFTPSVSEMYPMPQEMSIQPPKLAETLCGISRPGHFSGVATVLLKLFNIVQPQLAIFGKKDFQQLRVIESLVEQFNLPIKILAGETMREADGLAMSSRNGYLNPMQRQEAQRLYKVLQLVVQSAKNNQHGYEAIEQQTTQYLTTLGWIVDYIAIRSRNTLLTPEPHETELVALAAAKQGKTRLIDNIEFSIAK
jgi:pantoate--beta-alanine ligase